MICRLPCDHFPPSLLYHEDTKNEEEMNMTELVFILDRSGSMSGLEKDTIGGFNSMLENSAKSRARR